MENRATIKDIASAAGVSVATVSYIMNNTPGKTISDQTRNRVLAVAEELCSQYFCPAIENQSHKMHCCPLKQQPVPAALS